MDELHKECLKVHNEYRKLHGVPPLKLNPQISAVSQKWSDYLAAYNRFEHSQGSGYGENLAGAYGDPLPDGRKAVKMLYDEIHSYNFSRQGFSMNTGHFTQVVWMGSKELGVGAAKNSQGMWIMTFNYSPPGNMMGDFERNVFPVGGGPYKGDDEEEDDEQEEENEKPPEKPISKGIADWTEEKVSDWLKENDLSDHADALEGVNGSLLLEFASMYKHAPQFFYTSLKEDMKLSLIDILKFTKAVKTLT